VLFYWPGPRAQRSYITHSKHKNGPPQPLACLEQISENFGRLSRSQPTNGAFRDAHSPRNLRSALAIDRASASVAGLGAAGLSIDGINLQLDVVGLDLMALIDTRQGCRGEVALEQPWNCFRAATLWLWKVRIYVKKAFGRGRPGGRPHPFDPLLLAPGQSPRGYRLTSGLLQIPQPQSLRTLPVCEFHACRILGRQVAPPSGLAKFRNSPPKNFCQTTLRKAARRCAPECDRVLVLLDSGLMQLSKMTDFEGRLDKA